MSFVIYTASEKITVSIKPVQIQAKAGQQNRRGIKSRAGFDAMSRLALRMLVGDTAKYLGLIFAIAFSSFLIAQQVSIFCSLMNRTRSQIIDVTDADIWVRIVRPSMWMRSMR